MNINGVNNTPNGAPVNRQPQETNGDSRGRTAQIGKTVGRVLLGIVTLGIFEILRALKSRHVRQEATQPRERRVQNHGTVPRPQRANTANLWLARQFSETGDLHPMSFDKLFFDVKTENGIEGEVKTEGLTSAVYNGILKSQQDLNVYEARDIALEKINAFFKDVKKMHLGIDQREDLDPSLKEELKQRVLNNTDPRLLDGRAITPETLGEAVNAYKSNFLYTRHVPAIFIREARKFGLDDQLEKMDRTILSDTLKSMGENEAPPPAISQMKARAQEEISNYMKAKRETLDYIDARPGLIGNDRRILKDLVIRFETVNRPALIDRLLAGPKEARHPERTNKDLPEAAAAFAKGKGIKF